MTTDTLSDVLRAVRLRAGGEFSKASREMQTRRQKHPGWPKLRA